MSPLILGLVFGSIFSVITSLIVYKRIQLDVVSLKSKLKEEQENFVSSITEINKNELEQTKAGKELLILLSKAEIADFAFSNNQMGASTKKHQFLFYRPPENHVGVIYRFARFNRFANPERWSIILPFIESVSMETSLYMRTARVSLNDVYTIEKIALNVELKIFYSVDLRQAVSERRAQVLHFATEKAWEEIIHTQINDIARNLVFVSKSFDELTTQQGRSGLKQTMSKILSERVREFGILLNPKFSVNIVNLQPNDEFRKALMSESIAGALGNTAASRLSPILENFSNQKQEKAFASLIMQIASAIAETGQVPEMNFISEEEKEDSQKKSSLLNKKDNPPLTAT